MADSFENRTFIHPSASGGLLKGVHFRIPLSLAFSLSLMPTGPTPYNKLMSTVYFEDIKLHQIHRSREYPLNEKEIIDFAKQWAPQPFHIDPEFAKNTKFGGLSASGTHLVAICVKLV